MLILILFMFNIGVLGDSDVKRHVENSVIPINKDPPEYNLEKWVSELNLQHCVIVEIGENYCALFVEFQQTNGKFDEYFLGVCNVDVLLKWKYCSTILEQQRPDECTLQIKDVFSTRVHRRLCDFSIMAPFGEQCDCSSPNMEKQLLKVTGFPTCFVSPLPDILCGNFNVCGLASCATETVANHIVKFECSHNCIGHDSFCQFPLRESSLPANITSHWSDWSEPSCVDLPCRTVITEARCINAITRLGAIDCLGPGTSCCPADVNDCKCHLYLEGSMMKVVRSYTTNENYWQREEVEDDLSDFDYISDVDYGNKHLHKLNRKKRVELNKDPYFATIYALKHHINMKNVKLKQRDAKEEDFDDDDEPEDNEDNNEEDVIIEEDTDLRATTIADLEKGDIAQKQADSMRKNVLEKALDNEINEELKQENLTRSCSVNLHKTYCILILVLFVVNRF